MTDSEHAAAESEHAEAVRALARLEARIVGLTTAHADAAKAEADAALLARAKAAKRTMDVDVPKLLDEYDIGAEHLAVILGKLLQVYDMVDSVNAELKKNPVHEQIGSIDALYRTEQIDGRYTWLDHLMLIRLPAGRIGAKDHWQPAGQSIAVRGGAYVTVSRF